MRMEFDKLKNKYLRRAAIYGAAGGILCGLVVVGILLLALKTNAVVLAWYFYLLAGIFAAAACGAVIFLVARPSDLKLAKKLDKMYALDEKTQTMIEYESKQGKMLDMQREDAESSLKAVKKRGPSPSSIVFKSLAAAVAVALFVTGLAVPQKRKEVLAETPYAVEEWRLNALRTLIEDVKNDGTLKSGVRESYTEELSKLLVNLTVEGITPEMMTDYVTGTMYEVSDITIAVNTYDNIAYALTMSKETTISEALRKSAEAYTASNVSLNSYDALAAANEKLFNIIDGYTESACNVFVETVQSLTEETVDKEMTPYITAFYNAVNDGGLVDYRDALEAGGVTIGSPRKSVTSGDELYDALYDFYYTVKISVGYFKGEGGMTYTLDKLKSEIGGSGSGTDGAANTYVINSVNAMQVQAYTNMADYYVRKTLGSIFEVPVVGNKVEDGSADESDDNPENNDNQNSTGSGETQYPGTDYIYNPETGEYAFYISMLNDMGYREKLMDLLANDEVSEEVKNYIRSYLNYLTSTVTE